MHLLRTPFTLGQSFYPRWQMAFFSLGGCIRLFVINTKCLPQKSTSNNAYYSVHTRNYSRLFLGNALIPAKPGQLSQASSRQHPNLTTSSRRGGSLLQSELHDPSHPFSNSCARAPLPAYATKGRDRCRLEQQRLAGRLSSRVNYQKGLLQGGGRWRVPVGRQTPPLCDVLSL